MYRYFLHHILYENIANTHTVYIQKYVPDITEISGTQRHASVLHVKAPVFWVGSGSSDSHSNSNNRVRKRHHSGGFIL